MEDLEMRRRRALYRAQHRGTKELDIVMGRYAEARLADMSPEDLACFEEFLAVPEPQLNMWIMKGEPVEDAGFARIVSDLRDFNGFN